MRKVKVTFEPSGQTVEVPCATTLLEAATAAGVLLSAPCGGAGRCGKCRVLPRSGELSPPSTAEIERLQPENLQAGLRLACQTEVRSEAAIEVPAASMLVSPAIAEEGQAERYSFGPAVRAQPVTMPPPSLADQRSDLERLFTAAGCSPNLAVPLPVLQAIPRVLREGRFSATLVWVEDHLVRVLPGTEAPPLLGAAFDIGTTTVVGALYDLATGKELAVQSRLNPQAVHGADVLSRLTFAEQENGLDLLHKEIVACISEIIAGLLRDAGRAKEDLYEVVAVGNQVMTHALLKVPPEAIGRSPFAPVFRTAVTVPLAEMGLPGWLLGRLYVVPGVAGYVGADIVAGLVATRLCNVPRPQLFIDLGTNGEVVLCKDGELYACAAAAGPAFEGAQIACGMRATAGAVDYVKINDGVELSTIAQAPPLGLCGSGLLDATAELVRHGIVSLAGRFRGNAETASLPASLAERLRSGEQPYFLLAGGDDGSRVVLTQSDVRQLQLAKGAVRAAGEVLMARAGVALADLSRVVLAGAFGSFLNKDSALAVGLLPPMDRAKVQSVGNVARAGAGLILISQEARQAALTVARQVQYVELSSSAEFQEAFVKAMAFPPLGDDGD